LFGGRALPLSFAAPGQINAQVPYALPKGNYQLIVARGTTISTPVSVAVLDTQPGIFTTNSSGSGQGHVYKITAAHDQVLADAASPVKAGDVLTIYCSGLGEVTPGGVDAGSAAPLGTLESAVNPVTATIGGIPATVLFAGLTPGFTGLYQVNLTVPEGVPPGSAVPILLTGAGIASAPVTIGVH